MVGAGKLDHTCLPTCNSLSPLALPEFGVRIFVLGWGGLTWVLQDVRQQSWPPPARCQEHLPPVCDKHKCLQIAKCPQRVKSPQLRSTGSNHHSAPAAVALREARLLSLPALHDVFLCFMLANSSCSKTVSVPCGTDITHPRPEVATSSQHLLTTGTW